MLFAFLITDSFPLCDNYPFSDGFLFFFPHDDPDKTLFKP